MKGVLDGKKFPDCVAVGGAWAGDHQEWQIPYGALLPKKIDNVLAAGRCISGSSIAHASYRVTGDCVAMGQAAGTAAALAVKTGQSPGDVDVEQLREQLKSDGVIL